jgi:hypothetical protein
MAVKKYQGKTALILWEIAIEGATASGRRRKT